LTEIKDGFAFQVNHQEMANGSRFRQRAQNALAAAARSKDPTVRRGWEFVARQWADQADWWEKREAAASERDFVDWLTHPSVGLVSHNGREPLS